MRWRVLEQITSRDFDAAMKIVGGRKELADEMFNCFLEELPQMLQQIIRHIQAQEWDSLRETAHRLCGSSAVCGVPRIHAMIIELENAAKNRQKEQADRLVAQLETEAKILIAHKPR